MFLHKNLAAGRSFGMSCFTSCLVLRGPMCALFRRMSDGHMGLVVNGTGPSRLSNSQTFCDSASPCATRGLMRAGQHGRAFGA